MGYAAALDEQRAAHARVLEGRAHARASMTEPSGAADAAGTSAAGLGAPFGELLLVEHDPPVITLGRRRESASHVVAPPARLAALGVELVETDRGGDVTWHGPGQLVAYPILDLERLGLRIHPYMRLLEQCVIETLGTFGVAGHRDPEATGVWVGGAKACEAQEAGALPDQGAAPESRAASARSAAPRPPARKICAMGVRVSRWVSMHGLALNVAPDLSHFGLIVPCGLHGRPVTSMRAELGASAPSMEAVKRALIGALERAVAECVRAPVSPPRTLGACVNPPSD